MARPFAGAQTKLGFTVVGRRADGQSDYIGELRGLLERNTMRHNPAIDSSLKAASMAPAAQLEKRLQNWLMVPQRCPRQLHTIDREANPANKRAGNVSQQTLQ